VPGHDPRNLPLVRIGKSELVIASVSNAPYDETKQASWPGFARPSTSS
jgi:nitrate/nitrite transport system ATP-binding protein